MLHVSAKRVQLLSTCRQRQRHVSAVCTVCPVFWQHIKRSWIYARQPRVRRPWQFVSLWVMDGATHHSRHSRRGVSDKSFDTPWSHCSWCPSVVQRSRQKLVGDLCVNVSTNMTVRLRRRRRLTTLAATTAQTCIKYSRTKYKYLSSSTRTWGESTST